MREELRATLRRLGVTALFVTHDQEDAFAIADRVALIRGGRLLQVGSPEDLYDRPASREVAEFIGRATLMPGRLDSEGTIVLEVGGVERRVAAWLPAAAIADGRATAVLRPDALALEPRGHPDADGAWPGTVVTRRFAGAMLAYHVELADGVMIECYGTNRDIREGARVTVRIAREPVAVVDTPP
jgi:ABC-type Fe3+/spermidine/putrescine transport system ATPase subunit